MGTGTPITRCQRNADVENGRFVGVLVLSLVVPDADPKEFGVDFTSATEQGLRVVYEQGVEKGNRFLEQFNR